MVSRSPRVLQFLKTLKTYQIINLISVYSTIKLMSKNYLTYTALQHFSSPFKKEQKKQYISGDFLFHHHNIFLFILPFTTPMYLIVQITPKHHVSFLNLLTIQLFDSYILQCLSIYLSISYLYFFTFICLYIYLSLHLSIFTSIYLYIFLSLHLSIFTSIYLYIYLAIHLSNYTSI